MRILGENLGKKRPQVLGHSLKQGGLLTDILNNEFGKKVNKPRLKYFFQIKWSFHGIEPLGSEWLHHEWLHQTNLRLDYSMTMIITFTSRLRWYSLCWRTWRKKTSLKFFPFLLFLLILNILLIIRPVMDVYLLLKLVIIHIQVRLQFCMKRQPQLAYKIV